MRKSRQFIGTSVMDKKSGKLLGTIMDIIFIPGENTIMGFCVNIRKILNGTKILAPDRIHSIGADTITVKNGDILLDTEKFPDYPKAISEKKRITGMKVITNDGNELGFFQDIIIDEIDCSISGYILTDGIFDDILYGKLVLPYSDNIIFGQDAIVVDGSSMNMVLKNDISFKRIFHNAAEWGKK